MAHISIYTDGLCSPNPGIGTWAWIAFDEAGQEIDRASGIVGENTTNNVAEYVGAGKALRWLNDNHHDSIVNFYCDSQLVLKQITNEWACNSEGLIPLRNRCQVLLQGLSVNLMWIPSEQNKADVLTREIYFKHVGSWPKVYAKKNKKGAINA